MMIGKKVIDSEPITISEAREILMQKVEEKVDEAKKRKKGFFGWGGRK